MTDNCSMKKVSEVIEIPPDTTFPREVNMNKGAEEGKKPVQHKHVTDEQFKLQINGGRFGTANMLHGHGFKLGKNLIIICTLCPQIIEPPKNMRRHTDESALHKLKYQEKIDGAMHDEGKEYRFKASIFVAKYNVSIETLAGLCK